jgi:hypothetical protein
MDRCYTLYQFVAHIDTATAVGQIAKMFEEEFGTVRRMPRGGQCCGLYKRTLRFLDPVIVYTYRYVGSHR